MTIQSTPHYVLVTYDGRRLRSNTREYRAYLAGLDYPTLTQSQLARIYGLLTRRGEPNA